MSSDDSLHRDLDAAIGARRDLGPDYEPALVASFVEKVERRIDQRLDERLDDRLSRREGEPESAGLNTPSFVLGAISLGTGIPITAISAAITDLPGLVVAWLGIVGVNVAHALSTRSRQGRRR